MPQYTDLTGKHVTIVPAADTLSVDYRGKTGVVIGGTARGAEEPGDGVYRPATGVIVTVLIDGHAKPKTMHRAHLIVTPTPGTIEIDPKDLFDRLVDAAINRNTVPLSSATRQYREGQYDALYVLYCALVGQSDTEELATALAEAVSERIANSD